MARATKAELEKRLAEVAPLVCDCMTLREVRAWVDAKTAWGPTVSDSSLKYYAVKCRALMKAESHFDWDEELGVTKRRLERIVARAAAKGDLRAELAATRQLTELLGLAAPTRLEVGGVDVEAARRLLEEEIASELAASEQSREENYGDE